MLFSEKRNITRWIIIMTSFIIVSLILWNTYVLFQFFKNEERLKMELWAKAQKTLINADEFTEVDLPLEILSHNTSIPIILTEKNQIINTINIEQSVIENKSEVVTFLNQLKQQNEPIVIEYAPKKFQKLYYGDSALLKKLKYYPLALLLIIFLFGSFLFHFYKSTKAAAQNKLWAGMAKETAHQIGTPLSSLIGWVEILKADEVNESITLEIERDIQRLESITDRFSKIGSTPTLEKIDIVAETHKAFKYLTARYSKQIIFDFVAPNKTIVIPINATLHGWTIENLVKNAIDAMKGKGELTLTIYEVNNMIKINVSDTGSGIEKKQFKNIFEPGFTTKKRGWGLGLSLAKRIVEEYHKGRIKVLKSEIGLGTTIQISYKVDV